MTTQEKKVSRIYGYTLPPSPRENISTQSSSESERGHTEEQNDDSLKELGYNIRERYLLKNSNKTLLKGNNKYGIGILIESDSKNNIKNDEFYSDVKSNQLIPEDLKNKARESAALEIYTIALKRGPLLCIISRNDKGESIENYYLSDKKENIEDYNVNFYPVIKKSEIFVEPETILKYTNNLTRRFRIRCYQKYLKDLERTRNDLEKLNNSYQEFFELQLDIIERLDTSLGQLYDMENTYRRIAREKNTYLNILEDLSIRNEMMDNLLEVCQGISDLELKLDKEVNYLDENLKYVKTRFVNID